MKTALIILGVGLILTLICLAFIAFTAIKINQDSLEYLDIEDDSSDWK